MIDSHRPLVLLVDIHTDNREMYAEYLESRGFRVIACADSHTSLDVARRYRPDIILLELRMNGLNGLEVLARLRRERALAQIPVVALTASVLSFEQEAALAAGFTDLLPKPCFPEDVVDAIDRILARSARRRYSDHLPDHQHVQCRLNTSLVLSHRHNGHSRETDRRDDSNKAS